MSINYKNQGFKQTGTGKTTVLALQMEQL